MTVPRRPFLRSAIRDAQVPRQIPAEYALASVVPAWRTRERETEYSAHRSAEPGLAVEHDDNMAVPQPNRDAMAEIFDSASVLTREELAALSAGMDKVAGRLGIRRSWSRAMDALTSTIDTSGRSDELDRINVETLGAVVAAAISVAEGEGKDVSGVRPVAENYISTIRHGADTEADIQLRDLRKSLRQVLGRKLEGQIPLAALGVSIAARVALAWDLSSDSGVFRPADRDSLMQPWLRVRQIPQSLDR